MAEQRGFALYVGLSETKARESGFELTDVVDALRRELIRLVPLAESRALAAIGPVDSSVRDLDIVLNATGERAAEQEELRRPAAPKDEAGVVIDLARHRVLVDDRDARLTFKEFALLQVLVRNDGKTLTREYLREMIATNEDSDVNDRTIDVHVRRLRVKFGAYPDLVRTVHGRGYRFDRRRDVAVLWAATPSPDLV